MENKKITSYEAPQVEVIEVEVEKGFAASNTGAGDNYVEDPNNNVIW